MQDLQETLREYEKSYALLRTRIAELGDEITTEKKKGNPVRMLLQRRNLLYTECAEMLPVMQEIREYLQESRPGERVG